MTATPNEENPMELGTQPLDAVMREKGYNEYNWVTYVDEGANHSEKAWNARLHLPLTFLLAPAEDTSLAKVASPDGRIEFSLHEGRFGSKTYSVRFGSEFLVRDAQLGLRFAEQPGFDRELELVGTVRNSHDETWEQPWGERRLVRDRHEELLLFLKNPEDHRINLRVRVFDDGLGFRYEIPQQDGFEQVAIAEELTEFALPGDSTAWWIPGRRYNRYEYLYRTSGFDEIEPALASAAAPFGLEALSLPIRSADSARRPLRARIAADKPAASRAPFMAASTRRCCTSCFLIRWTILRLQCSPQRAGPQGNCSSA